MLKREKILKHAATLTDFENIMLISQSQRINIVGQNSQIIKTEIKMVVVRNQEQRGLESYCLIGTEFLFGKIKNVLKMDGGDSFIVMWMYIFTYIYICWFDYSWSSGLGIMLWKRWRSIRHDHQKEATVMNELESTSWKQWLKNCIFPTCVPWRPRAPNHVKLCLEMNCSVLEHDLQQLETPCQPGVGTAALAGALHCSSTVGLRTPFMVPWGKAQKVTILGCAGSSLLHEGFSLVLVSGGRCCCC